MFFYFSSSDVIGEDQLSEFWNRDDNASGSDEDISGSDGKSLSFLGRVGVGGGGVLLDFLFIILLIEPL